MCFRLEIRRSAGHIIDAGRLSETFPCGGPAWFASVRLKTIPPDMKSAIVQFFLSFLICLAAASCRSSGEDPRFGVIPEMREFADCSIPVPCMIVTPETLGELPGPVLEEAEKHCGEPGTLVVVSGVRPRYFRLMREQGRLLLGSVEVNPSAGTVFLSVLNGLGEAAETIRSVQIENPEAARTWTLGVFVKRYPELAARLDELQPGDARFEEAEAAAQELLSRGSTRALLEKRTRGRDSAAMEDAIRAEQEQIGVIENILNAE